jgi:hypothetical protein
MSQTSREQAHKSRAGAGNAGQNGRGLGFGAAVSQRHTRKMEEPARLEDETVTTGDMGARNSKVSEGRLKRC